VNEPNNLGYQPFNYNQQEYKPQNYSNIPNAPGSYKYLPAWEGNDPSLNSPQNMSHNMDHKQGPPKYLEPQEESKYNSNSQYDEEGCESDYSEGEESESDYDSEFSKTDDYRSASSLSNYQVPHENQRSGQYLGNPRGGADYQNMYPSIPSQHEMNPQLTSSIGSDVGVPQYQGGMPPREGGQHPYGRY
jgi:hypothetical protein